MFSIISVEEQEFCQTLFSSGLLLFHRQTNEAWKCGDITTRLLLKTTSENTSDKIELHLSTMHVSKYSRRTFNFRSHRRGTRHRPLSLKASVLVLFKVLILFVCPLTARTILNAGNPDAKRLYDDLLSNYNKLVRPVVNTTDPLTVRIKLKLSQLIDVVSGFKLEL